MQWINFYINLDHSALGISWKCGVVISFCILYVAPLFVYFLKTTSFFITIYIDDALRDYFLSKDTNKIKIWRILHASVSLVSTYDPLLNEIWQDDLINLISREQPLRVILQFTNIFWYRFPRRAWMELLTRRCSSGHFKVKFNFFEREA